MPFGFYVLSPSHSGFCEMGFWLRMTFALEVRFGQQKFVFCCWALLWAELVFIWPFHASVGLGNDEMALTFYGLFWTVVFNWKLHWVLCCFLPPSFWIIAFDFCWDGFGEAFLIFGHFWGSDLAFSDLRLLSVFGWSFSLVPCAFGFGF